MKRIKYVVFAFFIGLLGLITVNAAEITVSASSKTVTVGNTVKITVTVKGTGFNEGQIGSWEYTLTYDSSVFTFVSSTTDGGNLRDAGLAGETTKRTYTFKAKANGNGKFALTDVLTVDGGTDKPINVNKGSVTVTVNQQSDISNKETKSASTNAYLKKLEVVGYQLTPEFKKDVYSYEVEVPNDVTEVGINAFREDMNADIATDVKDIDHISLSEGPNKVSIVVTAEKGNKLTYTVNIKREETNPVTVEVNGEEYIVLRDFKEVEIPRYYSEGTAEIEGNEIPILESEATGYTLYGLKDPSGNIGLYYYENGEYKKYVEIKDDVLTLIPVANSETIDGYELYKDVEINSNKIIAYYKDADSDFVLIYAMNVGNGEKAWYRYDIKEGTLQRYIKEEALEETNKSKDIYQVLAIVFAIVAGIAILIVLLLMLMNNQLKKKNEKLIKKIKEKKVKIVEHPVFDVEVQPESWKNMVEPDDDGVDDATFFARDDSDIMTKINKEVEIKSFDDTKEEKIKLTKEEKTKEKEKKKEEEAELKAMRDDFLKTRELEITKELKMPTGKKKPKRKKKK